MRRFLQPWSLLLVVLALACAGCELGLDVELHVGRNGGGNISMAVSADAELQALAEDAGASPLDRLIERAGELEGWAVADEVTQDVRTVRLSSSFADPEEFKALSAQLAEALDADEVTLLSPFALTVGSEVIKLRGGAGLKPTPAVRDYGLRPAQVVRRLRRSDAFAYTVSATFPGDVVEAPGANLDGRTATWTVTPGRRVAISATAQRPAPSILPLVLYGLAGGALAAGALWWRRRGRLTTVA